jgi:hypothetical protein
MNVPVDQVGTPTYNRDLAEATKLCIEAGASGIVNIGGAEPLGRLAFAQIAVAALNDARGLSSPHLDGALLNGVTTSNAGQAAKRPLASGLTLDKLCATLAPLPHSLATRGCAARARARLHASLHAPLGPHSRHARREPVRMAAAVSSCASVPEAGARWRRATLIPGWRPRSVKEAIADWIASPTGKPLGQ